MLHFVHSRIGDSNFVIDYRKDELLEGLVRSSKIEEILGIETTVLDYLKHYFYRKTIHCAGRDGERSRREGLISRVRRFKMASSNDKEDGEGSS